MRAQHSITIIKGTNDEASQTMELLKLNKKKQGKL